MTRLLIFSLCLLCLPLHAATWYVDGSAPGTLNNGTTWNDAWTNVSDVVWGSIAGGDTIEISGGSYTNREYPSPWAIAPAAATGVITIRSSQTSGHNGKVSLWGNISTSANNWTLNGAKDDSYTNSIGNNTWNVYLITNNINFEIFTPQAAGGPGIALTSETNVWIKWVKVSTYHNGETQNGQTGIQFGGQNPYNLKAEYCWVTSVGQDGISANGNSSPVSNDVEIHHCLVTDFCDDGINAAGGTRVHHCIVSDSVGQQRHGDTFEASGDFIEIYNNIAHGIGNEVGAFGAWGTTNTTDGRTMVCSNFSFYGNLLYGCTHNFTNTGLWSSSMINVPVGLWDIVPNVTNMVLYNFIWANNTVIASTNSGPGGGLTLQNAAKANLVDITMRPFTSGLIYKNNVVVYGGYWFGGMPTSDGWEYDNTTALVDYNLGWSINGEGKKSIWYESGTLADAAAFAAASGFTHNADTEPVFVNANADKWWFTATNSTDYQLSANDTAARNKGANLSALNLPGLDTDLWGNTRGADGTWDIGANEYTPENLVLWLQFTNDFTTGTVTDSSGLTNHGLRYSLTNWPYATNGPRTGITAAHWTNMRDHPVLGNLGDYIAITNQGSGLFGMMTQGTVCVWAYANSNSYNATELISAHGTGQEGQSNCWAICRDGENFRFRVDHGSAAPREYVIYFPDDTIGGGSGADAFTMTNWAHYAIVWNGVTDEAIGYYNGVPFMTNTLNAPWLMCNTNMSQVTPNIPWVGIGCNTHDGSPTVDDADGFPNNGFFAGDMADVRIYNRALSASEITDVYNYNGGTTPAPAAPSILTIGNTTIGTLYLR